MNTSNAFLPRDLLPHREPMVLLDTVDRIDDSVARCSVTVRSDMPFVAFASVPSVLAVELIAQTVGIHVGHACTLAGEPIRVGYLIGVRTAEMLVDSFEVGDELTIEVRHLVGDHSLATYSGSVTRGGSVVATASVNVYRGEP